MATAKEPAWLSYARQQIGVREIKGPKHNSVILGWLKRLKAWWSEDETPWCGTFAAACMAAVGMPYPAAWYRAKAWASWGKPCEPCLGAVVVFDRKGGGHVGFAVGLSPGLVHVLGGNQGDAVKIMALDRTRAIAWRWPASMAPPPAQLPQLAANGAVISTNEA